MAEDAELKEVLATLTKDQVAAVRRVLELGTHAPAAELLGQDQIKALKDKADEYRVAQLRVLEATGDLWHKRLEMAISLGDPTEIRRAMARHEKFFDGWNIRPQAPSCW